MSAQRKTREQWGFDDWLQFGRGFDHEFNLTNGVCILCTEYAKYKSQGKFHTGSIDESARRTVEMYCEDNGLALPWRPDYDLSTVENCIKIIEQSQYFCKVVFSIKSASDIEFRTHPNFGPICFVVRGRTLGFPSLEDWQEAAQFIINEQKVSE